MATTRRPEADRPTPRFAALVFSDLQRYRPDEKPSWLRVLARCLVLPGMLASIILRAQQVLFWRGHVKLANVLRTVGVVVVGADFTPGMTIGTGLLIPHPMGVTIGNTLVIGDNVTLAQGATAGAASPDQAGVQEYPTICDGAILLAHAVVVGGSASASTPRSGPTPSSSTTSPTTPSSSGCRPGGSGRARKRSAGSRPRTNRPRPTCPWPPSRYAPRGAGCHQRARSAPARGRGAPDRVGHRVHTAAPPAAAPGAGAAGRSRAAGPGGGRPLTATSSVAWRRWLCRRSTPARSWWSGRTSSAPRHAGLGRRTEGHGRRPGEHGGGPPGPAHPEAGGAGRGHPDGGRAALARPSAALRGPARSARSAGRPARRGRGRVGGGPGPLVVRADPGPERAPRGGGDKAAAQIVAGDLRSGFPYTTGHAGELARLLTALLFPVPTLKGLITDLDDTLWRGLVGEVGSDAVHWNLDDGSRLHAQYQQLLAALAQRGVLVAIASKNDEDVVNNALARDDLLIRPEHYFPVVASWGPKSASVEHILTTWNIGACDAVFVDDYPLELAEVTAGHPGLRTFQFTPTDPSAAAALLTELGGLFWRDAVTDEDALRLASIRAGAAVAAGADRGGRPAGLPDGPRRHDRDRPRGTAGGPRGPSSSSTRPTSST